MASRNEFSSQAQEPHLEVGSSVRYEGKLYLPFELFADSSASVCVSVRTAAGGTLPYSLIDPAQDLSFEVAKTQGQAVKRECVLVLPDLEVPIDCELQLCDEAGVELLRQSQHIEPQSRARKSRQYLSEAKRLLYLELSHIELRLVPDIIIQDKDDNIVRARLIVFPVDETRAQLQPKITVMGTDGSHITRDWLSLGDNRYKNVSCLSEYNRVVDISFRIPAHIKAFTLCASLDSNKEFETFACVDADLFAELAGRWNKMSLAADADPDYEQWRENRRVNRTTLAIQKQAAEHFLQKPSFSIIVPLFKTPLDFLKEMVDSVLAQSYPHFELLLVNASPEDAGLADAVERYCKQDVRVRHIRLDKNYGITENSNAGIRAASSDFVAFLDHDDTVEPDILYWYAKAIEDEPECDMLYCDEDHLRDGHFVGPFFKPDWDIDLLRSENYIGHMLCVRKSLLDALDALPGPEFDGAQDHNLSFVVGEQARKVCHVRRMLYHWRMHAGSTAGDEGTTQKSYAFDAQLLSVKNHLERTGVKAEVNFEGIVLERTRLHYRFEEYPLVSIVIPNKDAHESLENCINSIVEKTTWPNYEIVIVENNSEDTATFELYQKLSAHKNIRVIESKPDGFNFSKLINDGFEQARGDYLLMLNNDMELITGDWLENMVGIAQEKRVGAVGAKLFYPDGTIQHCGVQVGRRLGPAHLGLFAPKSAAGYYENYYLPHQVSAVTGACLMLRRDVYEQVGGLDENNFKVNYNDIDYCMRLRKRGYAVVLQTHAQLIHFESLSRSGSNPEAEAALLFKEQGNYFEPWGHELIYGDPFYNKNFRAENAHYGLERP